MSDPLSTVHQSLELLFRLATERNGKYTYPEVQALKETIDDYLENPSKLNFLALKKAVRYSIVYIEKWQLDFDSIKEAIDKEAHQHQLPPIDWSKLLSHSNASSKFQSYALNHVPKEDSLVSWLLTRTNQSPETILSTKKLTELLLQNRHEHGFSKKLSKQLDDKPCFLFELVMKSVSCFIQIASTSLSLYLTDEQLAEAIIKHIPEEDEITDESVSELIAKLNNILSHGRSISTLLRNAHAKDILNRSSVFQHYQSDEYNHRTDSSTVPYSTEHRAKLRI